MIRKTKIYLATISSLESKELFDNFYNLMPAYRKQKIDRLIFDKDKRLSLGVGILLKCACKDFNIVGQDECVFENSYGKEYFENSSISFNLSHSKEMVMCVMSPYEVGCDIEQKQDISEKVCQRVFTPLEISKITQDSSLKVKAWTIKESYMKFFGKGFSLPPNSFEIDFENNKIKGDDLVTFTTGEIDNYYYSVCTKDASLTTEIIDFTKINLR